MNNQTLHKEMNGSKRRSRLGLGIASLPNSSSFSGQGDNLGIIEMVCSLESLGAQKLSGIIRCGADVLLIDRVAPAHPVRSPKAQPLTPQSGNTSSHVSSINKEIVHSSHTQHSEECSIQKNATPRGTQPPKGNRNQKDDNTFTAEKDSLVKENNTVTETTRLQMNTCTAPPYNATPYSRRAARDMLEETTRSLRGIAPSPATTPQSVVSKVVAPNEGTPLTSPSTPISLQNVKFKTRAAVITPDAAPSKSAAISLSTPPLAELNRENISEYLGTDKLADANRWKLLRRSKQLLAMRTVTPELASRLELRRDWNLHRNVETLLDCFPSLKHSYSSLRGRKLNGAVSILSNGQSARVDEIARSHSIRLDPVDSPKELYKYRQRIQKVIAWAHANELVPVMMTLTVFHRWNALAPLIRVLRNAWSDLFARSKAGQARKEFIGLRGYIRRMEETFNDGDSDFEESLNSGWHPHYHIILIVPREKLPTLSAYETELRKVWMSLVRKHYLKEFGEDIPAHFHLPFEKHGLYFSRYASAEHAARCGNPKGKTGCLFEVKDGQYLAKLMGTDNPLYGGDTELTYSAKFSKTPFDMLKSKVTANLSDLWCEYAIATKKIPCFTYSKGLKTEVDAYFNSLSVNDAESSVALPTEGLVIRLKPEDYQWLYRHFLIGDLLDKAAQGYEVAKAWLKDFFGIDVVEDAPPSTLKDSSAIQSGAEDKLNATSISEGISNFDGGFRKNTVNSTFNIKNDLLGTNTPSVASLLIICPNVTLSDSLNINDYQNPHIPSFNFEPLYENKAPP